MSLSDPWDGDPGVPHRGRSQHPQHLQHRGRHTPPASATHRDANSAMPEGEASSDLGLGEHLAGLHRAAKAASPDSVRELAHNYQRWSQVLTEVGSVVRDLDLWGWQGRDAELCDEVRSTLMRRVPNAGEDLGAAATAIHRYAKRLDEARPELLALEAASYAASDEAAPSDPAGRGAIPSEMMIRRLSGLDQVGNDAARTVRDQARTAPSGSAFPRTAQHSAQHDAQHSGAEGSPHPATSSSIHPAASAARPGADPAADLAPAAPLSPATHPAVLDSGWVDHRVWAHVHDTGLYTGDTPAPGPPLPPAADQWAPDDPRRKRYIEVQLPQGDRHDNLSWIAARDLGNPALWPQIYRLNVGLPQPDGGSLQDAHWIRPGWFLALPDNQPAPQPDSHVTPFGHDDHSFLPPAGPHDDPSIPVRTGPPEHTITPVEGVILGTGTAIALVAAVRLAGRAGKRERGHKRADRKRADDTRGSLTAGHPGREENIPERGPTIRAIHISLAEERPDAFYAPQTSPATQPWTTPAEASSSTASHSGTGAHTAGAAAAPTQPFAVPPGASAVPTEWTPLVPWTDDRPNIGPPGARDGGGGSGAEASQPAGHAEHATDGRGGIDGADEANAPAPAAGAEPRTGPGRVAHPGLVRCPGVLADHAVVVDLAALLGLGLYGEGARGALRCLLIDLCLPPTPSRPTPTARIYIPHTDLAALLDQPEPDADPDTDPGTVEGGIDPRETPRALRVVPDLDAALFELELEILRRSREQADAGTDPDPRTPREWEPIVLIARVPARGAIEQAVTDSRGGDEVDSRYRRMQSVLALGATVGIAAVLLGPWRSGTSCHVDRSGRVTSTAGPPGIGAALNGIQMNIVPAAAVREVFHLLPRADMPADPASRPAATPDTTTPTQDRPAEQPTTASAAHPDPAATAWDTATVCAVVEEGAPVGDGLDLDQPTVPTISAEPCHTAPRTSDLAATCEPAASDPARTRPRAAGDDSRGGGDESTPALRPESGGTPEQAGDSSLGTRPADATTPPRTVTAPEAPPGALLMILALGQLEVFARAMAGGAWNRVTAQLSKAQRVMLGALAAHTDPIPTERLLDMCWPGKRPDHAAMRTMHSFVYRLRGKLNDLTGQTSVEFVELSSDRYQLNTRLCWIDHHALHAHLPPLQISTDAQLATIDTVFNHYQAQLLDTLEYDADITWLTPLRTTTRNVAVTTAHQLADHFIDTEPDKAARYLAHVLTRIDKTSQVTARRLINLHLTQGRHAEADRVCDQLERDLNDLVGMPPDPSITQLVERGRRQPA
jgi:DNA-binding SARP family transcriptional activator